ncbi:MAG: hypothetical protein ACI9OB_000331 [Nonlabens sp.]|jgi:hypothetical protein
MTVNITPSARVLFAAAALALTLAGCATQPDVTDGAAADAPNPAAACIEGATDCDDTVSGESDDPMVDPPESGAAAGSCLAGDADCTDESYSGQDVARFVDASEERSGAPQIARGATVGATGRFIEQAAVLEGETLLEITFTGGACDLVEDVLVVESDTEVRVLVLSAQDASVEMCTAQLVTWAIDIRLDAPLGGRGLADLSG